MKRTAWRIALVLVCLCCICLATATAAQRATPTDLGSKEVTLNISPKTFTYDGTEHKPTITVSVDGQPISPSEYDVRFDGDKTNVGTVKVKIESKSVNYTGETTATYTIEPKSISDAALTLSQTKYTFDGTEHKPSVSAVKDGKTTLVAGKDYETAVAYADNKDAGTATVTITGKGNYKDTAKAEFTIEPKSISDAALTLSQTKYTFDGTEHKPSVSAVKDGKTALVAGKDYETAVAYADNKDAGTATVTITGKGNYKDTAKAEFTIEPKDIVSSELTLSPSEFTYTGAEQKPAVTVKDGAVSLEEDKDYTVSYSEDLVNVGTVTVTITGKNNYTGTTSATYEIKTKTITGVEVALSGSSFIYNGEEQMPVVTVKDGTVTLEEDKDYTLSYSEDLTNVGTVTVTITGKGNYMDATAVDYTIERKQVTVTAQDLQKFCGTEEPELTAVVEGLVDEADPIEFTLERAAGEAVGEYAITAAGETEQGNYEVTFVEGKMTISYAPVPDAAAILDGTKNEDWYYGEPVKVSFENYVIAKEGEWAIDEDGVTGFASYITCADGYVNVACRLRGQDGAITELVTVSYKQDTKAPEFTLQDFTTHISLEATDLPGEGLADISQASGVIISLWHNDQLQAEIKLVQKDPDKITEADYTSIGDWVFFSPGRYVITITDVAGNSVEVFDRTYIDTDGDGLNDQFELSFDSDPLLPDTDYDGLNDLQEYQHNTNPRSADTDGDGLTDSEELSYGLNPNKVDTDSDGVDDMRSLLMKNHFGLGETFSALNIRVGFTLNPVAPALTNEAMEAALDTLTEAGRSYLTTVNVTPYERKGGKIIARGDETINLQKCKHVYYMQSNADASALYGIYSNESLLVAFNTTNGVMRPSFAWNLEEIFGASYDCYSMVASDDAQVLAVAPWDSEKNCTLADIAIIMPSTGKVWQINSSVGASKFEIAPAGDKIAYLLNGTANLLDLITCNPLDAYTAEAETLFFTADGAMVVALDGNKANIYTVENDALSKGETTYAGIYNKAQPTQTQVLKSVVLGQDDLSILSGLYEGYTFDVSVDGVASSPASLNSLTFRQSTDTTATRQNSFFKQN